MSVAEPVAETTEAPAKPGGGRRRLLLLAIPVVLAGVGAGLWFSGVARSLLGLGHHAEAEKEAAGHAAAAEGAVKAIPAVE